MGMSSDALKIHKRSVDESHVHRLAAECIQKIEASGGVGCTTEGIIRVANAILKHVEDSKNDTTTPG